MILGALIVAAAVATGAVATIATLLRHDAARAVAEGSGPRLADATALYAALSDADATAATTFLTGGVESTALRRRYLSDVQSAGRRVVTLAGDPEAAKAVGEVASALPVYSGIVEAARVNNRQGLPVGAAYLRQASALMRDRLLPAAQRLYAFEATRLANDIRRGTANSFQAAMAVVGFIALAVLVLTQVYLLRLTARVFNPMLVLASIALAAVVVWASAGYLAEEQSLESAQTDGSDSVQVLAAARILALRAHADESLALVARGGGDTYLADYTAVMRTLNEHDGLLDSAGERDLRALLQDYHDAHQGVVSLQAAGRVEDSVDAALVGDSSAAARFDRLSAALDDKIARAQQRFEVSAADARDTLGLLRFVALQQGRVDAVSSDDAILLGFQAQDPYTKIVGPRFSREPYGIAINKGDPELVRFVNGVFERMRADGTFSRIYKRWLPEGAPDHPPTPRYRD